MQKAEIHWSPNDRNQLAEIGAEIIIHTFDRPLSGESGKCVLGGTNKKTTSLNYPLHEKNNIKCCAWWPSQEYPYVFAIGQPNGRIIFENVKDRSDPLSQGRIVIDTKQGRPCVALAWNPKIPNLLLSGFDRYRSENCLSVWDINHNGMSSPSLQTGTGITSSSSSNVDEYKRVDMLMHNQQVWKPIFDHGLNEQCHSLAWFKPNEKTFAACTTAHNQRNIRVYDIRVPSTHVISFPTKAPFNLCCDSSERYIAASVDKTIYVYDSRVPEKALIVREEHEPIVKLSWSRIGSSQLGYCIRDSPKFHVLSVSTNDTDIFVHRILQCPIQRYRIGLASFDWNYFDEHRLVLLSGKEYFDYVIPSRSTICYSPRNGLLWTNGLEMHPSVINQDHTQLTSKVLLTYNLSNVQNDRRNLTPTQSALNTELIQMDLKTMTKETQMTIEQIERWIKNANTTRDPYPFVGVIEALREAQPSSTSTLTHQAWTSTGNSTHTKTVYESPERQIVSQLCGWSNVDTKSGGYDRMASLLEQDEYEKVAALYIFQMNVNKALEVLNEGLQRGGKEELATLILALVGSIRATSTNNDDNTLINDFSSVTKLFHRPYVRSMFAFILTQDGNDLQYECVLDEQLDLNDKVAFAARYLNDDRLYDKLDKLADESRKKGDLQGILLTGLRQNGCELIQKYLDQTNDIRTAALLAIYVPEDVHQECQYVQEWIEGFRLLLDELQLWSERAEFDIYRSHVTGTTPHRRHHDRSMNMNHHFSCIFCQTPLEAHHGMSNQTSTTNSSSTPIPTTPSKPQGRGSQPNNQNRSSGSSSYAPPPNSELLMVCAKCRQVLPRCSICMMNLTTYIEDASYAYEPPPDKHALMSSQWFTWCRLCRHGGHAEHVSNWFAMNEQCPIAKCLCRCTLIDGVFF
ncbi:unnamed protein product [Adineta steineri]|uniref:WD repeat protein mio zinc-ribbon like domain-containing protein n=1 Tax=Adineta steineri TaxID=433720 RepID=A0A815HBL7_9BILA|nr:unnamed protein product [Adineta steineri]CAF3797022.1 unnamed protein product [Adineta steineri]